MPKVKLLKYMGYINHEHKDEIIIKLRYETEWENINEEDLILLHKYVTIENDNIDSWTPGPRYTIIEQIKLEPSTIQSFLEDLKEKDKKEKEKQIKKEEAIEKRRQTLKVKKIEKEKKLLESLKEKYNE